MGPNEQRRADGQEGRKRPNENGNRTNDGQLRGHHGRETLIDFDELRQLTSRYIGYIPERELYCMTPKEWKDWLIGGQDRLLDAKENNLHMAGANGMVQGGKRLTRMYKEIEQSRYEIRGKLQELRRKRAEERRKRKAEREAVKRGSRKFLEQFK